jgi:two-component system OmpR family sensor kinase
VVPLKLRTKLTAVFGGLMVVLLASAGIFLYLGLRSGLDSAIDDGLESRADVLAGQAGSALGGRGSDDAFAQVLGRNGQVLDDDGFATRPLLTAGEISALGESGHLDRPLPLEEGEDDEEDDRARIYAVLDGDRVVVAGTSLEDRDEALSTLLSLLLVGGPAVLSVVLLVAWLLAGAALKPVRRMARQAARISEGDLSRRLEAPTTGDEIAELGESLNHMLARLENAFEKERRFVDDASHELRTPLAILRTELELAMKGTRTRAELVQAVASAAEEAGRVNRLAEDLLLLARSDRGKLALRPEPSEAAELLDEAAELYRKPAAVRNITLQTSAEPGLELMVDRPAMRRALGNLIANAVEHASEGTTVTLAAAREGTNIVIFVSDAGPGFPEGFVERAFDPFTRSDSGRSRAEGGTGLGLAIVKGVVTAHGGRVSARNLPEGGAEVQVVLPASS